MIDKDEPLIVEHIGTYNRARPGRWFDNFVISARHDPAPGIEWSVPSDSTGIQGYSVAVDHVPNGTADETIDTTKPETVFRDLAPGTWFAHVRACDGAGNWGANGHVRIDLSPPE